MVRDQVRPRLALHLRLADLCDAANYEGLIMGALANVRYPGAETSDGFDSTVVDDVSNALWLHSEHHVHQRPGQL